MSKLISTLIMVVLLGIPILGVVWVGVMVVWTAFFSTTFQPLAYGYDSTGVASSSAGVGIVACLLVGLLFLAHARGGDK